MATAGWYRGFFANNNTMSGRNSKVSFAAPEVGWSRVRRLGQGKHKTSWASDIAVSRIADDDGIPPTSIFCHL